MLFKKQMCVTGRIVHASRATVGQKNKFTYLITSLAKIIAVLVLPVLVPELSYDRMEVANGTEAMDGWKKLISLPNLPENHRFAKLCLITASWIH